MDYGPPRLFVIYMIVNYNILLRENPFHFLEIEKVIIKLGEGAVFLISFISFNRKLDKLSIHGW